MCSMTLDTRDMSPKKKNKLGYHRQSVACSHCRRRKIRCLPSDFVEGKCENCMRTGKECHFLKVNEEAPQSRTKGRRNTRSKSFGDHGFVREDTQAISYYPPLHHPRHDRDEPTKMQPYRPAEYYHQPIDCGYEMEDVRHPCPPKRTRPPLHHRVTEPTYYPTMCHNESSMEEQIPFHSPVMHSAAMNPASRISMPGAEIPWPIYAQNTTGMQSSRASERSSSFDSMQPPESYCESSTVGNGGVWPPGSSLGSATSSIYYGQPEYASPHTSRTHLSGYMPSSGHPLHQHGSFGRGGVPMSAGMDRDEYGYMNY